MKTKHLCICILILLVSGCAGGRTARSIHYYLLDYGPPRIEGVKKLDAVLRVERFSIAQLFNNYAMAFRSGPYSLGAFPDDRWRALPGDLVTDCLLRDFRHADLFPVVFSYRDPEKARFVLEGTVAEFLETQSKGGREAILSLTVTLMDMKRGEAAATVVFQKDYSSVATITEAGPGGLAQGLSKSMEHLSQQIMGDVYTAVSALPEVRHP